MVKINIQDGINVGVEEKPDGSRSLHLKDDFGRHIRIELTSEESKQIAQALSPHPEEHSTGGDS